MYNDDNPEAEFHRARVRYFFKWRGYQAVPVLGIIVIPPQFIHGWRLVLLYVCIWVYGMLNFNEAWNAPRKLFREENKDGRK